MIRDQVEPAPCALDDAVEDSVARSRARFIEIATALFRQYGVRATSVDDIVKISGLSKPTFYRRFAAKDDLVVACLVQDGHRVRQDLVRFLGAVEAAPAARLRAIGGYYAGAFEAKPRRGLFALNLAVEYPDAEGKVGQAIEMEIRAMRRNLDTWLDVVAEPHRARIVVQLSLAILGAGAVCQVLGCAGDSLREAVEALVHEAFPGAEPGPGSRGPAERSTPI